MKKMKELFTRVLCIFPFEEKLYRQEGVPADYVGNPLADELPLGLSQAQARDQLFGGAKIGSKDRVVAFLPGSRPGELARHVPLLEKIVELVLPALRECHGGEARLHVLIPFADPEQYERWRPALRSATEAVRYHLVVGRSAECLVAADAGLIKSGTATLEAGVLGLPHAVFYRASGLTGWIFRNFIQKKGLLRRGQSYIGPVGLVNLFTGWCAGEALRVPEYLLKQASPENLGAALIRLLFDAGERSRQQRVLSELRHQVLGAKEGAETIQPSRRAAQKILDVAMGVSGRDIR
jgi:lipid-A-disaccharide synthase